MSTNMTTPQTNLEQKIEELLPKNLFSGDMREEVEWRMKELALWTYQTVIPLTTDDTRGVLKALETNARQAGII